MYFGLKLTITITAIIRHYYVLDEGRKSVIKHATKAFVLCSYR